MNMSCGRIITGTAVLAAAGWASSSGLAVEGGELCQTGMVLVVPFGADGVRTGGFVASDGSAPSATTFATVKWDDSALTVVFECEDEDITALRTRRDDPDIWRDDCVEIFLDIGHRHNPASNPWIHAMASASGGIADAKGGDPWFAMQGGGDRRFSIPGLTNTVERTAHGWRATVTVPWSDLGAKPKVGDVWGFNLNRENHPEQEYTGWAPTRKGFQSYHEWGHLVFAPARDDGEFASVVGESSAAIGRTHAAIPQMLWKAGTARVNITPDQPLMMAGYGFRDRPADGKATDLWAKALALEDAGGRRAVLVTMDLIGIERSLAQSVCARLEAQFGLRRDQVALCTSHTHSGPVVGRCLWPIHYEQLPEDRQVLIDAYAQALEDRIVAIVGEALQALAPARLGGGSGLATFGVNRRMNREGDVPRRRATGTLAGPADPDVPVLAVRRTDGSLLAVVFGYACHATVLSDYQWNADYPGYAQAALEERYPGAAAMFWNGCGSDVNPLPRRSVELAQGYGKALADAVGAVLSGLMYAVPSDLQTAYREIDLPMEALPGREDLERNLASQNAASAACARVFLREMDAGRPLRPAYPYPVAQWRLGGEIQWVFLGGEVSVDYALRIKAEKRGTRSWVAAYANDVMGYIPSRRLVGEGGYEANGSLTVYGLPAAWTEEIEDRIVSEISY